MEDQDFQVVRKNLNILSVLIIVLAFTNAKINTLNFLGIDMQLDGAKFYKALFIGYLYFIWRYCTKLDLKAGFWNDFRKYYLNSAGGIIKKHNFNRYQEKFKGENSEFKEIVERDSKWNLVSTNYNQSNGSSLTEYVMRIELRTVLSTTSHNKYFETNISVSLWYLIKRLIVFCLKHDKFGDYLFPFVPVILNLLFLLFKTEWQGSLRNIFN